jgi:preprotein translocase subunit SecY
VLSAFRNAFKIPDLRKKILFTLAVIAVYRLGSHIPLPGIDFTKVEEVQREAAQGGIYGLINLFSGGALTNFAIFALGIMPYITSSIIMQLLTVVIPRLEAYAKEGEQGQKKITQYTRYMTVVLALLQSLGIVVTANSGRLFSAGGQPIRDFFPDLTAGKTFLVVLTLTAGTAMIMWLGELVTQRGIGNGMSILIFSSIISRFPAESAAIYAQAKGFKTAVVAALGIGIVVAVVLVEQAQRRIPVQYAKRVVGRKLYGGSSTYIPLKVNQAGVIPIIFASSLLYLPVLAATIMQNEGFKAWVDTNLAGGGDQPLYIVTYFLLIIFFTYFYTAITFNPVDVADNMKKYGGFIPGIRPGRPTAEYLDHILTRITLPGSAFLGTIAVLPFIVQGLWDISAFPFGGTAVLIVVGVGLETMKQLESQLLMRHYEGFLK